MLFFLNEKINNQLAKFEKNLSVGSVFQGNDPPPYRRLNATRSLGLKNVKAYANLCNVRVVERSTPRRRNIVRIFQPIFVVFLVKMAEDGKVSKVLKYILFAFNLLYWVS